MEQQHNLNNPQENNSGQIVEPNLFVCEQARIHRS